MHKTCLFLIGLVLAPISSSESGEWFRGNTHTHTDRSDGDSPAEVVVKWYHDHDYNFLVLTDHNQLTDPNEVELPENKREDFILIPGEEITGNKTIHTTALNVKRIVPWEYDHRDKSAIIQNHVNGTIEAEGHAILNHPNFQYAASAQDILPVKDLQLFEIYNGHPATNNFGDSSHPSTEAMWDELLTNGMVIYGVASDDAHHFQSFSATVANPGRGWVMVYASQLAPDEIANAMVNGNFYASSGVFLTTCDKDALSYFVEVDTTKTRQELSSLPSVLGRRVNEGTRGYKLEFVGPYGKVLASIPGTKGTYTIRNSDAYVRARITFTVERDDDTYEEYYAWGQPVVNESLLALRSTAVGTAAPSALLAGRSTPLEVSVVLDDSVESGWSPQQLILDLSSCGGPPEVPLHHTGGGCYVGSATVTPRNGSYRLAVMMETAEGERLGLLRVPLEVYPAADLMIYDDAPADGWAVEDVLGQSDPACTTFKHTGSCSHEIGARTYLKYVFDDPAGIDPFGYTLEFWINGGEGSGQDPSIAGKKLSEWGIAPESNQWTQVIIPASELATGPLTSITIFLQTGDPFYLDDMKLVAEELPTAVEEVSEASGVPQGYALAQNVPNPFNPSTEIRFSVPKRSWVRIAVYNVLGQVVRELVEAQFPAAVHRVQWDGADRGGRSVSSGVYLCRMTAGATGITKKMVVLR